MDRVYVNENNLDIETPSNFASSIITGVVLAFIAVAWLERNHQVPSRVKSHSKIGVRRGDEQSCGIQ